MLFQGAAWEAGGSARPCGAVLSAREQGRILPPSRPLAAGEPPLQIGKRFIRAFLVSTTATHGLGRAGGRGGMSNTRLGLIGSGRWLPSSTARRGLMAGCFLIYFIYFFNFLNPASRSGHLSPFLLRTELQSHNDALQGRRDGPTPPSPPIPKPVQ